MTATATSTSTEAPLVERSSEWVVVGAPRPTRTPSPAASPSPLPRLEPTAPPSLADCVDARWGVQQVLGPQPHALVSIRAVNRCGRPIAAGELWFRVTGLRSGQPVRSVTGHNFDTIFPNRSETIGIGLPGAVDWYDRITVEIVE